MDHLRAEAAYFYFDEPVSKSGLLCHKVNSILKDHNMKGKAETFESPDHHLKKINEGYCATSDSVIIESCQVQVIDLAKYVLESHFQPEFVDLNKIIAASNS